MKRAVILLHLIILLFLLVSCQKEGAPALSFPLTLEFEKIIPGKILAFTRQGAITPTALLTVEGLKPDTTNFNASIKFLSEKEAEITAKGKVRHKQVEQEGQYLLLVNMPPMHYYDLSDRISYLMEFNPIMSEIDSSFDVNRIRTMGDFNGIVIPFLVYKYISGNNYCNPQRCAPTGYNYEFSALDINSAYEHPTVSKLLEADTLIILRYDVHFKKKE